MSPILVRTASGTELSFASREEFGRAVEMGRVISDSEVFHTRGNRWLPVTAHPAWPSVTPLKVEVAPSFRNRNSDLVLIYPDTTPAGDPLEPLATAVDLFDAGRILAAEEIHRILHAPRISGPALRVSGPQDRPLFEKAMPTFSRAFQAAADLVQIRIS